MKNKSFYPKKPMKTTTIETYLTYYQRQIDEYGEKLEYIEDYGIPMDTEDIFRKDENIQKMKMNLKKEMNQSHWCIQEFHELSNYLTYHVGFYNPKYCTLSHVAVSAINNLFREIYWPSMIERCRQKFVLNRIHPTYITERIFRYVDTVEYRREQKDTIVLNSDFAKCGKYLKFNPEDGSLLKTSPSQFEDFKLIYSEEPIPQETLYIDNVYIFVKRSMYSNNCKINQELRILLCDIGLLPKYKGDWDYSWSSRVKKHKPKKSRFMKSDLYQYLLNQNLLSISKDTFSHIFMKYLFFKIAHGGRHLFSPTQYQSSYEGPYSDQHEDTYLNEYTVSDGEAGEDLTIKYVMRGDDFFRCCYFLPDVLIERILEDIHIFLDKNHHFIDILYEFIKE